MNEIPIRSYAHLGDAVYEVFIREKTINATANPKKLHRLTVSLVNAEFQASLLEPLESFVNEDEAEILRRARNLQVTTARRTNHKLHRLSTAFEALVGYLYTTDTDRLKELYQYISPIVNDVISNIKKKSG